MDKMLKAYLDRAAEIIGDRTPIEIKHDDEVVKALNQGHSIEDALAIAARKYPDEAINWDESYINDISAHYEYQKEHKKIMKMIEKKRKK